MPEDLSNIPLQVEEDSIDEQKGLANVNEMASPSAMDNTSLGLDLSNIPLNIETQSGSKPLPVPKPTTKPDIVKPKQPNKKKSLYSLPPVLKTDEEVTAISSSNLPSIGLNQTQGKLTLPQPLFADRNPMTGIRQTPGDILSDKQVNWERRKREYESNRPTMQALSLTSNEQTAKTGMEHSGALGYLQQGLLTGEGSAYRTLSGTSNLLADISETGNKALGYSDDKYKSAFRDLADWFSTASQEDMRLVESFSKESQGLKATPFESLSQFGGEMVAPLAVQVGLTKLGLNKFTLGFALQKMSDARAEGITDPGTLATRGMLGAVEGKLFGKLNQMPFGAGRLAAQTIGGGLQEIVDAPIEGRPLEAEHIVKSAITNAAFDMIFPGHPDTGTGLLPSDFKITFGPEGKQVITFGKRSGLFSGFPLPIDEITDPVNWYYSALEKVVEAKLPNKIKPEQLEGIFNNSNYGIKKEEYDWSGLDELVANKKATGEMLSKKEVLDKIAENRITINETELGGFNIEVLKGGDKGTMKELVLSLPESIIKGNPFTRGHYPSILNTVGYIRFNTRSNPETGQKELVLQNVQSDLHQQGREIGYNREVSEDELQTAQDAVVMAENKLTSGPAAGVEAKNNQYDYDHAKGNLSKLNRIAAQMAIPNAPFKSTWPELLFKRMVRYAADNNIGKIVWTTGEQQVEYWEGNVDTGRGHKIIYDEKLPSIAKMLAKKFGGKYQRETLPVGEAVNRLTAAEGLEPARRFADEEVHSFTIPDKLRRTALYEGQKLFMSGIPSAQDIKRLGVDLYRAYKALPEWRKNLKNQIGQATAQNLRTFTAESKVKDLNGNLIPVYHGTQSPHEITEVSLAKFDKEALYGPGFYTTQSPEVASEYASNKLYRGNVIPATAGSSSAYKLYLNIRKPLDMDALADPDFLSAASYKIFNNPDYDWTETYGKYPTNEKVWQELVESFNFRNAHAEGSSPAAANKFLQSFGYDGITHLGGQKTGQSPIEAHDLIEAQAIADRIGGKVSQDQDTGQYQVEGHRVWIAFNPEQVKSATANDWHSGIRQKIADSTTLDKTQIKDADLDAIYEDIKSDFAHESIPQDHAALLSLYGTKLTPISELREHFDDTDLLMMIDDGVLAPQRDNSPEAIRSQNPNLLHDNLGNSYIGASVRSPEKVKAIALDGDLTLYSNPMFDPEAWRKLGKPLFNLAKNWVKRKASTQERVQEILDAWRAEQAEGDIINNDPSAPLKREAVDNAVKSAGKAFQSVAEEYNQAKKERTDARKNLNWLESVKNADDYLDPAKQADLEAAIRIAKDKREVTLKESREVFSRFKSAREAYANATNQDVRDVARQTAEARLNDPTYSYRVDPSIPYLDELLNQPIQASFFSIAKDIAVSGGFELDPDRFVTPQVIEWAMSGKIPLDHLNEILERNGKSLPEFFSDIQSVMSDAGRKMAKASHISRELNKLAKTNPELAKQINKRMPRITELAAQIRYRNNWDRLSTIYQGSLVSAFRTAMANLNSAGMVVGLDTLGQTFDSLVQQSLGKSKNNVNKLSPVLAIRPMLNIASELINTPLYKLGLRKTPSANRQLVEDIMAVSPETDARVFTSLSADIEDVEALGATIEAYKQQALAMPEGSAKTKFVAALDRVSSQYAKDQSNLSRPLIAGENITHLMGWANRGQEIIMRRAIFEAKLRRFATEKGIDLDGLQADKKLATIPEEIINRAANETLRLTFGVKPEGQSKGKLLNRLLTGKTGFAIKVGAIPFPNFILFNFIRYQYEHSPAGLLSFLSSTGREKAMNQIADGDYSAFWKPAIGMAIFGMASQVRRNYYDSIGSDSNENEEGYFEKVPRKIFGKGSAILPAGGEKYYEMKIGKHTIDTRFTPFAPAFALADYLERSRRGLIDDRTKSVKGVAWSFTGVDALRAGEERLKLAYNFLTSFGGDEESGEKASQAGGKLAADTIAAPLIFLTQFSDLVGQWYSEEAKKKELLGEGFKDTFSRGVKSKIPYIRQSVSDKESPTRELTPMRHNSGVSQLTGITQIEPKNYIESQLDQLDIPVYKEFPRTGNYKADQILNRTLGEIMSKVSTDLESDPSFTSAKPETRAMILADHILPQVYKAASQKAIALTPELAVKKEIEKSMSARMRIVVDRQRAREGKPSLMKEAMDSLKNLPLQQEK